MSRSGPECFNCGAPASEPFGNAYLCADCAEDPGEGDDHRGGRDEGEPQADAAGEDTPDADPVSSVPAPLEELGAVFLPIDPGEKGACQPRTEEYLYAPDDDVLEAYLEAGHNYGIACHGDLAVLDADEPDALADLVDALPATAWQVSGSRSSEHYFLRVPGLDEDIPLDDPDTGENLGHIKAAPQSYVVGPGSRHPSGNRYGPLRGDGIATVDETTLREHLAPYRPDGAEDDAPATRDSRESRGARGETPLNIGDVLTGYTEGVRTEHPFHGSDTGANFLVDEGGETWRCWRHNCTGNALHLVGVEQGIVECGAWDRGGLDTETWREIFSAAREAGYDLPEFDPGADAEQVPVLPDTPALESAASGWDWRHAGRTDDTLSIDATRARTTDAIADAYESGDRVLVEALPTMGKSYGAVKAAAATDTPVSTFTGRGRNEQYEQIREWCDEHGLAYKTLPSFVRDCDTANGEHGQEWVDTVLSWYRRGATPQAIHKWAADVLGRPLPCQEHEGQRCPYASSWDFDPDEYDVLLGHYNHAHKSKVTAGRVAVFDEFPGSAYETEFGADLQGAVSYWLATTEAVPFEDYTDLVEHRDDSQRRSDALAWFLDDGPERAERAVFEDRDGHAAAPLAVFTLLAGEDLGNGVETADLEDVGTGAFNRETGAVTVLQPPALEYATGVVALDGTPTQKMWELALGERLNHRAVLQDDERAEYIRDALNLNLVRTTDAVKPYNSADHVATEQDAALLEAIADEHGQDPAVITSATARDAYDDADVLDVDRQTGAVRRGPAQHVKWYGDVLGSNEYDETRVGAVIGSNHYGDHYIKKWGAYAGEAVERDAAKGGALSYDEFGDRVLTHMREHDTLQAAMRFGRDGNGAAVYVHTDTLPEWVPLAGEGRVVTTWSDGMRAVIDALDELESATTATIAERVDIGRRQVLDHLETLRERGVLAREQDEADGRRVRWSDEGLDRVGEHGDAELNAVSLDELDADEVAELSRTTTYTWEFRNSRNGSSGSTGHPAREASRLSHTATDGGDPPSAARGGGG